MNRFHFLRSLIPIAICCFTLAAVEKSPGGSPAPDAAAIDAVVDGFHQALASGDRQRAMSLVSPAALIVEAGTVQTRREYESEHLAEDIAFAREIPGRQTSRSLQQNRDVAWVTNTFRVTGKFHDKAIDNIAAETAILIKTADGWQIVSLHWSSHKAPNE